MDQYVLRCKSCGAQLDIEDGIDTFFCKYCGHKIILSGQDKEALNVKARIKEKQLEHKHSENIIDKAYSYQKYKLDTEEKRKDKERKDYLKVLVGCALFIIVIFLYGDFMIFTEENTEAHRIEKLENLVDEINDEIRTGAYDEALINANKLYYDGDDEKLKEHWDDVREDLIVSISEEKTEAAIRDGTAAMPPDASKKLKGQNYEEVVNWFTSAGFTNVSAKEYSKKAGFLNKKDSVALVTIAGKSEFTEVDQFASDSEIIVYYYSK